VFASWCRPPETCLVSCVRVPCPSSNWADKALDSDEKVDEAHSEVSRGLAHQPIHLLQRLGCACGLDENWTDARLWLEGLSMMTMSPGRSSGTRTWDT